MKLHRISVLMIPLAFCSAHVLAAEPTSGSGWRDVGSGHEAGHMPRAGGGDDGNGDNDGNANKDHAAQSSATVQAITDYCASVDPNHRSEYAQLANLALEGIGRKGDDGEYQQKYASVSASLTKIQASTGAGTCKAGIAGLIPPTR